MTDDSVYEIKVLLQDIQPPVWRRLQIPGDMSLLKLHEIIQKAMGWKNSHLHQFVINGKVYSNHSEEPVEYIDQTLNEANFTLEQVIEQENMTFTYEYDFGDGWVHEIEVEKILRLEKIIHPICLDGERACPPEDSGGPAGYNDFLNALQNPEHELHNEVSRWVGGGFDSESLDVIKINRCLKKIR